MTLLLLLGAGAVPPPTFTTRVALGCVELSAQWCPTRGPLEVVPEGEWVNFRGLRESSPITTRIGRADEVSQFGVGSLSGTLLTVIDPADPSTPIYDPDNADGPYFGKLKPRRQTRWRAKIATPYVGGLTWAEADRTWEDADVTWEGESAVYPLWRGYLDGFPQEESINDRPRTVPLGAKDAIGLLSDQELFRNVFTFGDPARDILGVSRLAGGPDGSLSAGQLSGERARTFLDAAGWPEVLRDIDDGLTTMSTTMPTGKTWQALTDVEKAEDGFVFVNAAGEVCVRSREAAWSDPRLRNVQAAFSDQDEAVSFTGLRTKHDVDYVRNTIERRPEAGVPGIARDEASIVDYFERPDSLTIASDDAYWAQHYAEVVLNRSKEVATRIPDLEIRPLKDPSRLFQIVLDLQILDRVAITRLGVTTEWWVQGIAHRFSWSDWVTTLNLTPVRSDDVFTFGDPTRDLIGVTPLA